MPPSEIIWLNELDATRFPMAGAKMARLGSLRRNGLQVPEGFAVATGAFERFLRDTGIAEFIRRELMSPGFRARDDGVSLRASKAIRRAIEGTPVPDDLAEAISAAYDELVGRRREAYLPVAVRSSATGEDGKESSFAGQFDTYLGVCGGDQIVLSVRQCWASLFSARAIAYRAVHRLDHSTCPMAVGVLELIPARASGVAFSVDPVTGKRDRIVIEASWGWGEALVQGLVTPDHAEVGKSDRRTLSYRVAHKAVVSAFDFRAGHVVERPMPTALRDARVLDEDEISAISDAVLHAERCVGQPVDVEWVVDRRRRPHEPVTVVQVRPETTHATREPEPSQHWDPVSYAMKYAVGRGATSAR